MREFSAQRVPKPNLEMVAINELTQGARALDLEIGAGQGLHAIRYSSENPERRLIAVERTHARFAQLERRKANHDCKNLHIYHADAVSFVTHFLPYESLDRVFLLYPNPYVKTKQANLRWHNSPFFSCLLSRMKPGAELTLATNLEWYAKEARKAFAEHWQLGELEYAQIATDAKPRTHFEKKYLARFETCWNLRFRKR